MSSSEHRLFIRINLFLVDRVMHTLTPSSLETLPETARPCTLLPKNSSCQTTSSQLALPASVPAYFDPTTVVSLDTYGKPCSRFGDGRWDLSAMARDSGASTCFLYFFETPSEEPPVRDTGLGAIIREQQKALLWLHMNAGEQFAQTTTVGACSALTQLARGAYRRQLTLFDLLCDPQALGEEAEDLNTTYAKRVRTLLKTLWRHRDLLRIDIEVRLRLLSAAVTESAPGFGAESLQTPIIPSRIYCSILGRLIEDLDWIEKDLPVLLNAYREERTVTLRELEPLASHRFYKARDRRLKEIREEMRGRGWEKGTLREFIAGEILGVQLRLMTLLIAFTGMRSGEARLLPLKGVIEEITHRDSVHIVINGFSHKFNKGIKKPASWVTNHEGHRAVLLAQSIAETVLETVGSEDADVLSRALLFCSTDNPCKMRSAQCMDRPMRSDLFVALCPRTRQDDIDELNALELERGWLREGIAVGKPWPLAFHQLRRSLSVYAHRSGMVSLPALKGQLQHLTDEMRAYYSDGFCRTVNLVFDREHFSHEWSAAKAESSFLAFSLAVLFSDEDLIGSVGGRGAVRMKEAVSSRSRSETLQLFKDGKLAYRETVLGGCTAVEGCDRPPLEPIPWDCLERDCINAVVLGKRLNLLVGSQESVVAMLERDAPGSVEHRLEADHLRVLLKARERLGASA